MGNVIGSIAYRHFHVGSRVGNVEQAERPILGFVQFEKARATWFSEVNYLIQQGFYTYGANQLHKGLLREQLEHEYPRDFEIENGRTMIVQGSLIWFEPCAERTCPIENGDTRSTGPALVK